MVRPKKHLGQHFLKDENIARKIVASVSDHTQNLLEIGPGTGVLTRFILEKNIPNFYLIEIDHESVDYLIKQHPSLQSIIIKGDFLKINIGAIFKGSFSIIGNFPYNISSQILFRVLDLRNQVEEVVGMFQKEVADRILCPPGSKKYGILSVLVQAYFETENLFSVSENVFVPPPNVKSAVIRLRRNEIVKLDCNETLFFQVVKTAFNQRRKMLRNALQSFPFEKGVEELLSKRAEQLKVEEFIRLTNSVLPT